MVKIKVVGYDEGTDEFQLQSPEGQPEQFDFTMPGMLLPALIGEGGEPAELQGREFEIDV